MEAARVASEGEMSTLRPRFRVFVPPGTAGQVSLRRTHCRSGGSPLRAVFAILALFTLVLVPFAFADEGHAVHADDRRGDQGLTTSALVKGACSLPSADVVGGSLGRQGETLVLTLTVDDVKDFTLRCQNIRALGLATLFYYASTPVETTDLSSSGPHLRVSMTADQVSTCLAVNTRELAASECIGRVSIIGNTFVASMPLTGSAPGLDAAGEPVEVSWDYAQTPLEGHANAYGSVDAAGLALNGLNLYDRFDGPTLEP